MFFSNDILPLQVMESHDLQARSLVLSEVCSAFCAFMRFCTINKKQQFLPSSPEFVQEFDKLWLLFLLGKRIDKALLASRAEDVGAFVGIIDFHKRMTSSSSPSSHDDGN